MAAPLLQTRLPGDAAASSSGVKNLSASRAGISDMLAIESDFFNSPLRKTVRFGGTVTEVLLKYKKECYVHNLVRISVYFPTLRHEILEVVIEKLLKLDDEDEETEHETNTDPEWLDQIDGPSRSCTPGHLAGLVFSYIKDVCSVDGNDL
nr:group 10 secretory phospholipase A2 isoform X5 [Oryctolagus cuniculus]